MPGRGHGKESQMDYGRVNTSFGRDVGSCYVCHRRGHLARERPEKRRGGSDRQGFGSDQCHQNRVSVNRNFRGRGVQSLGGPRFSQPYNQSFERQIGQQDGQPTPCQRCGGRIPHSFNILSSSQCSLQDHLCTVCFQAQPQ